MEVNGQKVERETTTEKVINVATIRGVFGPQFEVTGLTIGEARDLSLLLRSGSLAAPVDVVEERAIGPSLGQENIDKGVRALEIGMLAVFVFMALYYHAFGLVADAVLLANVILLTALLSMLRASLSLPGIAGIILTVGIAVDANVLIYERIREELRNGVSPQAAIRAGFDKAFSAIADSNVTALIAGLALWVIGTGAIRGFAIVLTLGIATSMFTSLLGSRALITLMYGGRRKVARLSIDWLISTRKELGTVEFFHRATSFPFMSTRKVWYGLSAVLILISIVSLFTRGLNLGVDFTGGVTVQASFPAAANRDAVSRRAGGAPATPIRR